MPNHIRNIVTLIGSDEEVARVLEFIEGENGKIDFQNIVPMPLSYLNDERWYGWRNEYWNTKWNAYDIDEEVDTGIDPATISFNTAWSAPIPVFKALSARFPAVGVKYVYADEDWGYNCGKGLFVGGVDEERYRPEGGSDEAVELYLETHPEDEPFLKKVDGEWNWVYDEDEDDQ